ncbi:hypothetical protein [Massilia jejuensis]|uniref:hypothetical protein n=1 Tax=Massilia jejuensis TaxID=648894 RepID=UPI0036D2FF0F
MRSIAALNELRYFDARGLFSTGGVATLHGTGRRYLRHDSTWSWADPAALASLRVGDLVNRSFSWTRSLRMAGVEWRNNFELRPDLVTYPVAGLKGSAVVPSSVSLFVNGIRAGLNRLAGRAGTAGKPPDRTDRRRRPVPAARPGAILPEPAGDRHFGAAARRPRAHGQH